MVPVQWADSTSGSHPDDRSSKSELYAHNNQQQSVVEVVRNTARKVPFTYLTLGEDVISENAGDQHAGRLVEVMENPPESCHDVGGQRRQRS